MASSGICKNFLGMDPLLRVFTKLYIGDILTLDIDNQLKGVYYYKNHAIQRVDIIGVVVKVQQSQRFIKHFVDDGTGVIPVICWLNEPSQDHHQWLQDIPACLAALVNTANQESGSQCQLGDLIHVQGKIREFHQQREISAFSIRRCTDPMEEVVRMAELPELYAKVYDRPFQPPPKLAEELQCSKSAGMSDKGYSLMDLEDLILSSFSDLKGDRFVPNDLLNKYNVKELLVKAGVGQDSGREFVEKALKQLEMKGFVFQTQQGAYRVVSLCSDLEKRILKTLTQECQNTKYADSGCHISRVYDILRRQMDFSKVTKAAVQGCLATLESRSDVISTSSCHYIAFGT